MWNGELLCIEDDKRGLTKGKVYNVIDGRIHYDRDIGLPHASFEDFKYYSQKLSNKLVEVNGKSKLERIMEKE